MCLRTYHVNLKASIAKICEISDWHHESWTYTMGWVIDIINISCQFSDWHHTYIIQIRWLTSLPIRLSAPRLLTASLVTKDRNHLCSICMLCYFHSFCVWIYAYFFLKMKVHTLTCCSRVVDSQHRSGNLFSAFHKLECVNSIEAGQRMYRYCWNSSIFREPNAFENAVRKIQTETESSEF